MLTILIRTLIVYAVLIGALRLMGKRQVGELEISELITTLLISEIAALPIENSEYPLAYAIIPLVTLLFLEITASFLLIRVPLLKQLFSSRPAVLVKDGKPLEKELRRVRISLEELISALRQQGATRIDDVAYAILEPNGQISVIERSSCTPPTAADLGVDVKERGITHILIADGKIDRHNLSMLPNGAELLGRGLRQAHCRPKDILLMLSDDLGTLTVIPKRGKRGKKKP